MSSEIYCIPTQPTPSIFSNLFTGSDYVPRHNFPIGLGLGLVHIVNASIGYDNE